MKYQRPRGTNDLTPDRSPLWRRLRHVYEEVVTQFGYAEVDPPIFEATELFARAVGEDTDVVSKEMYSFTDRKGRSLSLRPEGTAGVVRMVIENGLLGGGGILRLAYWGPMFRYDRPQAGRYRQFHQFGVEALGEGGPALDAELIELLVATLRAAGLGELRVDLGSVGDRCCRPAYVERLREALTGMDDRLCPTCRERRVTNPLRVFDCKETGCHEALKHAPRMLDHLCDDCRAHLERVEALLADQAIPFRRDRDMVRGLDYYTRTVFEVHDPGLGAQSALGGGGRYDHLVEDCGGPPTPAVGFSAGIERLLGVVEQEGALAASERRSYGAYLSLMTPAAEPHAARIAARLRRAIPVEVDFTGRSLKAQLKTANQRGVRFAIILGPDEIDARSATLKDLDSGVQKTLPESDLLELIQAWLASEPPAPRAAPGR
ncbi:MAG: histidine--tRNA ligase [Candidatus Krumholzibacteriota bacterium]|nr:histidine--tRNA ligase [Candidatus Krumholzibacteriota bacterium]